MQKAVAEEKSPSASVNEIFRRHGATYAARYGMTSQQRRVMQDIIDCRSGALGGHIAQCDRCGEVQYSPPEKFCPISAP